MKKILLLSLLLISTFSGCRTDNDPAPGERPEERLNKVLTEYKELLVSAEHGWKAVLYPGTGGGYSFLFRFKPNDRIVMSGDINAASTTALESTYRLKTMQQPSLVFDTYSYLHVLTDPDETISGGDRGQGLRSDFEFAFESVTPETITLRGNFRGSRLVLTRATSEEADNFIANTAASVRAFENIKLLKTYFKRLTIGANVLDLSVDTERRSITFTYGEANVPKQFTSNFFYSREGITLITPFTANDLTITHLNAIQYDAGANTINVTINNVPGTIREADRPAVVNVQGARSLVNATGDDYWITGGFETADKEDLLDVFTIPNMYFIAFWPKFNDDPAFDLMGFVLLDPVSNTPYLAYGPTAVSSLSPDGRIIFNFFGNYEELYTNREPVPDAYAPIVTATKDQWTDPEGFYYVQESEGVAVLVSAKDAKIWMRLFR